MWPFKKREDQLMVILSKMLEQHAASQQAMLQTVERLTEAAKQQGEVLGKYLDLFKSPEPTRRWTRDIEAENLRFMADNGYPVDGTEEEQARWLAEHLDD